MDRTACLAWLEEYFHPGGLRCPHRQTERSQANEFRKTKKSNPDVYRYKVCRDIYNLYSGPIFEGRYVTPVQTVFFLRDVLQGKSSVQLACKLEISRTTATDMTATTV